MILLQLTANTGPEECCLAVRKALQLVLRECAGAGATAELLEQVYQGICHEINEPDFGDFNRKAAWQSMADVSTCRFSVFWRVSTLRTCMRR